MSMNFKRLGRSGRVDDGLNALEVCVHHRAALFGAIEIDTDGPEKFGERLNLQPHPAFH